MLDNAKNFAKVTVSTGYDAAATSIVLSAGEGAKLPTVPFNVVWYNATDYPDPSDDPNKEIVRVTAIATDTLTVTRAQEGTSASTKNTGGKTYKMIAGLTALYANTIVTGPASATDNAIARFDATTGKLLQDSAITIEDLAGGIINIRAVTPGSGNGNAITMIGSVAGGATDTGGAVGLTGGTGGATSGAGGNANIYGGNAAGGNSQGGLMFLSGGNGIGSGAGGDTSILGGVAGATGIGGNVAITGGTGGATSGAGGHVDLFGGIAQAGNTAGGYAAMGGGHGFGSGAGGGTYISAGTGGATGQGGQLIASAGLGGATSGDGGNASLEGGGSVAVGLGGNATVIGGAGGATSGDGGIAIVRGGSAAGGNSNGGSVVIQPGAKNGSGLDGQIQLRANPSASVYAVLDVSSIASTTKTFTFPNVTGTLALTSDLDYRMQGVSITGTVPITSGAANTLTDITGLVFTMVSGGKYYFRAMVFYTADATTIGSRWSVNTTGGAPTAIAYTSRYTLTASTWTENMYLTAVQLPAAASATSVIAGNVAIIEGTVTASANGTLQVQGAREVTLAGGVTVQPGSSLTWTRLA